MIGDEAGRTVIRFDIGSNDYCSSKTISVGSTYTELTTDCNVAYLRWLDTGDQILFHEYGHAWSNYYAYIVQQDPTLTSYLRARGIDPSDSRLGTSHAWSRHEMIAEDYRQLFGSPNAQLRVQENTDIPLAKDVPGLEEFLSSTFMRPPAIP